MFFTTIEGKKIRTTVKGIRIAEYRKNIPSGSFIISDNINTTYGNYDLTQIIFTGFDKPAISDKETVFISNRTDRTLTSLDLQIEYLTTDSIQMHKRDISIACEIPAGETRIAAFKSWDQQNSFHYIKSPKSRKPTTPFIVKITLTSYSLRINRQ